MRSAAHPVTALKLVGPWLFVAGASLFAAAWATGQVDVWVGRKPGLLLLALLVGGTLFVLFAFLGSTAVVIWPIAATGGFLLQFPRDHPVLTFDRAWIGGLLVYIALNRRDVPRIPATRFLLGSLLWLVVAFGARSFATSARLGGPISTWLDAIVLPTILFVACEHYCLGGPNRLRRLAGALMIAGGILGAIGIAERVLGFELATLTGGSLRFDAVVDQTRISGPYPAPEPYALALITCLAATLYWIQSRRRGSNFVWALAIVGVELAGIGLTLFRAAWIGAIVVVIASFFRPRRFGRMYTVIGFVIALSLVATSQLQQNRTFQARLHSTSSIYSRLATYRQDYSIFRSAPAFGVGVNQYNTVALAQPPQTYSGGESVPYPHSSYLGLLAEQGLVGFLPLLVVSYAAWRFVRRLHAAAVWHADLAWLTGAVAGAAAAYFLMSLTLTMLPYEPSNAFFAALLGAAAGRLELVVNATNGS